MPRSERNRIIYLLREVETMDFTAIISAISAVGFPIVFCIIVYKTMVDSIRLFNEKLTELMKQHADEAQAMQKSLDDNTAVIRRLLDKIGEVEND